MEKHLHIVSLTVPYPVNYGGVYDLFYKLEALHAQGIKIHLHCFDYNGSGKQPALLQYCASVQYYTRNTGYKALSSKLPYIVNSRKNDSLLNNLLQDDYPILMEGIHCTYLLTDKRFANRKTIVRLHNVEYLYYKSLFASSRNIFKKIYYAWESLLLKRYEKYIAGCNTVFLTVSPGDNHLYAKLFGATRIHYLPLFLPASWQTKGITGMGAYCLYHGDLSVAMNEKAAIELIKVFKPLSIPLVIAGRNPSPKLRKLVKTQEETCLVENPSESAMQDMIAKAHINILPSFSSTGIKIKLLNALFNGRHCVTNTATVFGTGLDELCHVSDTAGSLRQRIETLYHQPFTTQEREGREAILLKIFNNTANAQKLVELTWD